VIPVLRAAGNYCAFIETRAKSDTEFLVEVEGLLLDLYATAVRLEWPTCGTTLVIVKAATRA
jgi:hypothetical protein